MCGARKNERRTAPYNRWLLGACLASIPDLPCGSGGSSAYFFHQARHYPPSRNIICLSHRDGRIQTRCGLPGIQSSVLESVRHHAWANAQRQRIGQTSNACAFSVAPAKTVECGALVPDSHVCSGRHRRSERGVLYTDSARVQPTAMIANNAINTDSQEQGSFVAVLFVAGYGRC